MSDNTVSTSILYFSKTALTLIMLKFFLSYKSNRLRLSQKSFVERSWTKNLISSLYLFNWPKFEEKVFISYWFGFIIS